jgi:hypothetical protein
VTWEILHGDVRKILKTQPNDHFDAVLSDPPYAYKFMGKRWDYALPSVNVWTELLRVVTPGAHVMLFGGPRTFHRLVCAVEDAGFIPLDLCMYLHAGGFPKSLDISKAIDKQAGQECGRLWRGYGTALKPAYEPVLLAMRMLDGTFAENAQRWGTGGLAIDAGRIGLGGGTKSTRMRASSVTAYGDGLNGGEGVPIGKGRWPANVALDEEAAAMLDAQSGDRGDDGGASRFFFTAKVSRAEREQGCDELEFRLVDETLDLDSKGARSPRSGAGRGGMVRNAHPTLKAIALTRWLATLLLPPPRQDGMPRRILVPFSGAGSEMIGCLQAGWDEVVGIEGEQDYIEIAKERITKGGVFSELLDKRMLSASRKPQAASRKPQVGGGSCTASSRRTREGH